MLSEPVSPIWTFHFKLFFFNRVFEWKVPQGDRGGIPNLDPWKYMCLLSMEGTKGRSRRYSQSRSMEVHVPALTVFVKGLFESEDFDMDDTPSSQPKNS